MLDFYLIVSDYRDAYRGIWLTIANTSFRPTSSRSPMTAWSPNMRC